MDSTYSRLKPKKNVVSLSKTFENLDITSVLKVSIPGKDSLGGFH